jgi:hypothetical protein
MRIPYDTRGCFQSKGGKQFTKCARCDHGFIDWIRKDETDSSNREDHKRYKAEVVEYNKKVSTKMRDDKKLVRPALKQKPLVIRCNCEKMYMAFYKGTCPNNCKDGSCVICSCSCAFVCSTTNWNAVAMAVMERKKALAPSNDRERIDHARLYLQGGVNSRCVNVFICMHICLSCCSPYIYCSLSANLRRQVHWKHIRSR